jgi:6-phosphogluconolactonase (cycloisomerase 2 family)
MRRTIPRMAFAVAVAAALFAAQAASGGNTKNPKSHRENDGHHLVFVQTNQPTGNQIVVYDRAHDGTLSEAGRYDTGGLGGTAVGAPSDRLASQASLVYDRHHHLLFAVNAGSDTLSVFSVDGDRLVIEQVLPSGGGFPASIAVHRDLLYVMNAGGAGVLQGYTIAGRALQPLAGSARSLGLANTDPPGFLTSPGQVGFTPDGTQLIATTKASGSQIQVFQVERTGLLSATAVRNPSATPVPFAFTFAHDKRLVMGEAAVSAVTTYVLNDDGTLSEPHSLGDGQAALCWITRVRGFYYVSNTGSNNISGYRIGPDGQPMLIGATGIVATTETGPIDSAQSGNRFLYVETGISGTVDEYRVNDDGTLLDIGKVVGLPSGIEGIAAT